MTSGHLIADLDLSLGCDITSNQFIYPWRELIAVFTGENPDLDYYSGFAMRNPQRSISDLSGFLTEDSAKQSFLSRKIIFALWCNLSNEDVC